MIGFQDMLGAVNNRMIERNVDIVFVFDASKRMEYLIKRFQQVESIHDEILERARYHIKSVSCVRFKAIWYRDFLSDGDISYGESKFFVMPTEEKCFKDFLCNIQLYSVHCNSNLGLAALDRALKSDFVQEGDKKRHIVLLFTDAIDARSYEWDDIPNRLACFYDKWGCLGSGVGLAESFMQTKYPKLDMRGRRLVLFAPNEYPWCEMEVELEHTLRVDVKDIIGKYEVDIDKVFDFISYSF